ncbi:MAG TPA: hypothetical protein VIC04_06970, partial [Terriglobia bacterium]
QCHYPLLLGWMEEVEVSSPIFHPSLWQWAELARPRDLCRASAFRKALLMYGHPCSAVPDSNTGRPLGLPTRDWRDLVRNQFWYPLARHFWHKLGPAPERAAAGELPDEGSWPPLAPLFRTSEGARVLEEGLSLLAPESITDPEATADAVRRYRSGDDRLIEALLVLGGMGRWLAFLKDPERHGASEFIRTADRSLR